MKSVCCFWGPCYVVYTFPEILSSHPYSHSDWLTEACCRRGWFCYKIITKTPTWRQARLWGRLTWKKGSIIVFYGTFTFLYMCCCHIPSPASLCPMNNGPDPPVGVGDNVSPSGRGTEKGTLPMGSSPHFSSHFTRLCFFTLGESEAVNKRTSPLFTLKTCFAPWKCKLVREGDLWHQCFCGVSLCHMLEGWWQRSNCITGNVSDVPVQAEIKNWPWCFEGDHFVNMNKPTFLCVIRSGEMFLCKLLQPFSYSSHILILIYFI